jgi:hypothetical protein
MANNSFFGINLNGNSTTNFTANTTNGVIGCIEQSTFMVTGVFGATFNITNSNADGYGVLCTRGAHYVASAGTTITFSTNQTLAGTKSSVGLQTGSTGLSRQPISDVSGGCKRILKTGALAAVAAPGPFSTSQNDYATGGTQNCSMTFG